MSCGYGCVGSRYGWQRPSPIGASFAALLLFLCVACGRGPQPLYKDAQAKGRAGWYDDGVRLAEQGLTRSRENPGWFHRFRLLKVELLVAAEKPGQALAVLDSPAVVPCPSSPEFTASYLYVRGYALSQLGRYSNARPLLERARAVAASAGLAPLQSTVLVRLGTVLFFLGERAQAEECYGSALARADAAGDPYLQARAQEAIGFLYLRNSHYDECATWSARALHAYEAQGAEIRTASVADNLGWCEYRLGKDDSQALFARAQELFTKHRQWGALAINLNANGAVAIARGDLPAARSYYERVIGLAAQTGDPQTLADGRTNLATTLVLMGEIAAAEAANTQALDMPTDRVDSETRLRMKLNAGRIEAARGHLAKAEAICRAVAESGIRQPRLLIDATLLLAKLLDRRGRPRDSERALQRALAYLDDSRAELSRDDSKIAYSAALIQAYRDYVDLLCRRNRPLDALEVAESSRGRLLAEQSNGAKAPATSVALRELARRTGTVFLFYWIAPGHSHLWAIAPTGIEHVALPAGAEIQTLTDSFRRFIESYGDPLSVDNPGRRLFAELIEPVHRLLPPGAHVVIVPDGPLYDINFESLPVPAGRQHYWLEDAIVSVAPSLGVLLHAPSVAYRLPPRLLLIGDALSAGQGEFPRLTGARSEMERIRSQFPPGASVLCTGADATPDAYAAADPSGFSIIHFAAHATANRESPLDSAVVLTPRRGIYKLYARDIRTHPIRAGLVTISACQSAGARTYAGEGLVGFAWAFLGAGARNVIAGLWEVDDRSTAQLMEKMYRELQRGTPPTDALHLAKLELAGSGTSFRKPYYWAPFQLFTGSLQ